MAKKSNSEKIAELKAKLKVLSDRHERYVDKYIIGIQYRMNKIEDEITKLTNKNGKASI